MRRLRPNRAELLTQIDGALAQASAKARDRDAGQASLLDLLGPMEPAAKKSGATAKANGVPDFSAARAAGYEKELLGFYITGHPLDDYARISPRSSSIPSRNSRRRRTKSTRACAGSSRRSKFAPRKRTRSRGRA